jgi:hypothetical protein
VLLNAFDVDSPNYREQCEQELYQGLMDMIPGLYDRLMDDCTPEEVQAIADLVRRFSLAFFNILTESVAPERRQWCSG